MNSLLERVQSPADLQSLSVEELQSLAGELRATLISTVSCTGGHLASNLGVVELTIALLKIFQPPEDKVVWDVSHQTYAWKLLTGRRERFSTLRQTDGLSGFLRRDESPCDAFGAGHSGTAISAALGLAAARDRLDGHEHVVAVVGDGSLGCGMSFEAFNNLGSTTSRLIVVLNDNEMSIAANVGAMSRYLGRLLVSPRYNRWKRGFENWAHRVVGGNRLLRKVYSRTEEAIKGCFLRSGIFEEFGLRYVGPVDGHNLPILLDALQLARDSNEPILIHVATTKGKGYAPAEAAPDLWHSTGPFDIESGMPLHTASGMPGYARVFGATLERLAASDSRIVAITAAMAAGTGLQGFAKRFPGRFFDVGIAEEHAVTFAAGLAARGLRPVLAVYSTFLQRAVDQVIHDVCLQNLPVILAVDRAGVVGDDGPTHHGVFDLALLRGIPNLVLLQPRDEAELARMLHAAVGWGCPVAIRYPRGAGPQTIVPELLDALPLGQAEVLRSGRLVQLWALGDMVPLAQSVAAMLAQRGFSAGVVNARFVRPLDRALLERQADQAIVVVTLENGLRDGGFGSAVEEALADIGYAGRTLRVGWPNEFVPHGDLATLHVRYGLTPEAVFAKITPMLS
ncbi:MAG: 1-deoxy-D-xylulose-5-phosphate synthase [bacterium]